jgi:sec-independent protein translocase protein TatB
MPFLENLDGWKLLVLALLGIFILGPDKLPKYVADGVKMLRNLRDMARNATGDLSRELGTDISLEDLNPKAFIRKHVLSEEDEKALRAPLEELYKGVREDVKGLSDDVKQTATALTANESAKVGAKAVSDKPASRSYDLDAT